MKHLGTLGRIAIPVTAFLIAVTGLSGVAYAADPPTTPAVATLGSGTLTISTPLTGGTFGGDLLGQAQPLNANEAGGGTAFSGFSVDDARGIGVGWSVTMQATVFDNATVAGKDIVANSLTAPLFAVAKADDGSSALPGTLYPAATIDTGGGAGVVMAATSANGQGMGTYNFTAAANAPWTLALTADEYAGTYNSTVTTTLATLALPALYSFSPSGAGIGTEVSLSGVGFTGAISVSFGGHAASIMTVHNDTHITVTVPENASTGNIVVHALGGDATSATEFTVGL